LASCTDPITAFPDHADRVDPLVGWRLLARIGRRAKGGSALVGWLDDLPSFTAWRSSTSRPG
jgi:hypothetical protein